MTRFKRQRDAMVQHQLIERGIADERVLDAMREVPREQIVPETHRELSYRAIGVIYRPETERVSHHFETVLPRQFDEYIWFDETSAVRPLDDRDNEALDGAHPLKT